MKIKTRFLKITIFFGLLISNLNLGAEVLSQYIYGWQVIGESTKVDEGYILENARIEFPSMLGGGSLVFPEIHIGKNQELFEEFELILDEPLPINTGNGLYVEVDRAVFKPTGDFGPGLYLDGTIKFSLERDLGRVSLTSDGASFFLNRKVMLDFTPFHDQEIILYGMHLRAEKIFYGKRSNFEMGLVAENLLRISEKTNDPLSTDKPVIFPRISFYSTGDIAKVDPAYSGTLSMGEIKLGFSSLEFKNGKFLADGWLHFPGFLDSVSAFVAAIEIRQDGSWGKRKLNLADEDNIREMRIRLSNGVFENGVILIADSEVFMPGGFDEDSFRASSIRIDQDGVLTMELAEDFTFLGKRYRPQEMAGDGNVIILTGVSTEEESLSDTSFTMRYNTQGYIEEFKVNPDQDSEETIYTLPPDSDLSLVSALERGDGIFLKKWLDEDRSVNVHIKDRPVLIDRIMQNDIWSVQWLLENGADVDGVYMGKCALSHALEDRDLDQAFAATLIKYGADPLNIPDGKSNPLALALTYGRIEIFYSLLEQECDLEISGLKSGTMFDQLLGYRDYDLILAGVEKGIKPVTGSDWKHPLEYLIFHDNFDYKKLLDLFIGFGFSPLDTGKNGKKVIDNAISEEMEELCIDLLHTIPPSSLKGTTYSPMLVSATKKGLFNLVALMLEKGVIPAGKDSRGNSLHALLYQKAPPELIELAAKKGLIIPQERAGISSFPLNFANRNPFYLSSYQTSVNSLVYCQNRESFLTVLQTRQDSFTPIVKNEIIQLSLDGIQSDPILPAEYSWFDSPIFLEREPNGGFYMGFSRPDLERKSGVDGIISYTTATDFTEWEQTLTTDDSDYLLDIQYPEIGPEREESEGVILIGTIGNPNTLYAVPFNSDGIVPHTIPIYKEGTVIDAAVTRSDEGFIVATLLNLGDNYYLDFVYRSFDLSNEKSFRYPIDNDSDSKHQNIPGELPRINTFGNIPEKILLASSANGVSTCFIYSRESGLVLSINVNMELGIELLEILEVPGSIDVKVEEKNGNHKLIIARKKLSGGSNNGEIWILEMEKQFLPEFAFVVSLKNTPTGISTFIKDSGALGVLINDSSSRSDPSCTLIQFDETNGGILGRSIDLSGNVMDYKDYDG